MVMVVVVTFLVVTTYLFVVVTMVMVIGSLRRGRRILFRWRCFGPIELFQFFNRLFAAVVRRNFLLLLVVCFLAF